jgi:hypothetical protein
VVSGGAIDDDEVTLRLGDAAGPDLAWAATLEHVSGRAVDLLAAVGAVVGEHRAAVAAGGWTRMRSVRETKLRTIPRLGFSAIEQPGARGAALFAACAAEPGATVAETARRFARTVDDPGPVAAPPAGTTPKEEPRP